MYQLREECEKFGLDSTGPVRSLRPRLVQRLRGAAMAENQDNENVKASGSPDLSLNPIHAENPILVNNSHVPGMSDANPVFVELMRQVPP